LLKVSSFSGANASAKIAACVAALPPKGGVCDARDLAGTPTLSPMTIAKPVELIFGSGTFQVTGTITFQNVHGAGIAGAGAVKGFSGGTNFVWMGNLTDPMFDLKNVEDSTFHSFSIYSSSSHPLAVGVRSENGIKGAATPSHNTFRNVLVDGTNRGGLYKGFQYALGAGGNANNDVGRFYNVSVVNYTTAGWSFEHAQSKAHAFFGCGFQSGGFGKYGVTTALGGGGTGGSFMWFGGGGGYNSVADFYLGAPNDAILISGGNFEGSSRLLETTGASSNPWPVEIEGVRWANNNLNPDGRAVLYTQRGPLILLDNDFEPYATKPTSIYLAPSGPAQGIAIGNGVSSSLENPFTGNSSARWTLLGNFANRIILPPSIYGLIEQGAGAPHGPCATGTMYSRTDGRPGSTLYVCEAGAWVAK